MLKIQLQSAGKNENAPKLSATGIALKLIREKGIFGLYKGIGATACRDIWFSIIYFPLFATLNSIGPRKNDDSGEAVFFVSFASGLVSGAVSALFATPFDVIKTRLQILNRAEGEMQYNGIIDCLRWEQID